MSFVKKAVFLLKISDEEITESIRLSLPLVVVQLIESVYSLTDTYFVSGLGSEALAGVGIAGYLTWLLGVFTSIFQAPLSILVSQYVGAGKTTEARRVAGSIIMISALYSIALSTVFVFFAEEMVVLQSGASGRSFIYAVEYLRVRSIGFAILTISMMFDSIVVASGRTKYSMVSHLIGAIINIGLDPLLIYGLYGFPRLEVAGAAFATLIASGLVVPIQLFFLGLLGLVPTPKYQPSVMKQALTLGLPVLFERFVLALGNNLYAGVIARLGDIVMASHNIGLRIESIIYMPGFAFMLAATTLVGHRVGRGEYDSARRIGLKIIQIGAGFMAILGVLVALTGFYIVAPFSPIKEIRELASLYLLLAGLSELGLGLAMVASGAIRGAGDTRIPFIVNSVSIFGVRVVLSMLLAWFVGVIGPWIAMFIEVYVRGIVLYILFRSRFHRIARRLVK